MMYIDIRSQSCISEHMPCSEICMLLIESQYLSPTLATTKFNLFMNNIITTSILEHQEAVLKLTDLTEIILQAGNLLKQTIVNGGRVFICGNGGSAADAQHFAAELTGRFERSRRGLPALSLTTDTSAITAIGNDFGFDFIFSRQLEALALPGDLLIAISTSGNSVNVSNAVVFAKENALSSIGLLGRDGGILGSLVDFPLVMPSNRTARVQELHILVLHMLCEIVDTTI